MLEETIQRQYNNKDLEIQKNRKSELKIEELEYGITYSSYLNKIGVEKENLKKIKNDEINRISRINTTFNGLELKNTYLIYLHRMVGLWLSGDAVIVAFHVVLTLGDFASGF